MYNIMEIQLFVIYFCKKVGVTYVAGVVYLINEHL